MLKMMANENMGEYGADGWVDILTVRAVIDAYDKGLIRLSDVGERGPRRKTPLNQRSYSRLAVAIFLGWTIKGGAPTAGP
jgi:hypothetical protein